MKEMSRRFLVMCASALSAALAVAANRTSVDERTGVVTVVFDEVGGFTWRAPSSQNVELLVVGGGGGGGSGESGGGGGGGQVYHSRSVAVTGGAAYSVAVGSGGVAGKSRGNGGNGGDSAFGEILCGGGGGGGAVSAKRGGVTGANSGGAQAAFNSTAYSLPEATGKNDAANGWYGGNMGGCVRGKEAAGGGGGACGEGKTGTKGTVESPGAAGDGGEGYACDITGATVYYGCGGGGGASGLVTSPFSTTIAGGKGGNNGASGGDGATGNNANAMAGFPATGTGGGGGGWNQSSAKAGGAGGSGIVVVRYQATTPIVDLGATSGYLGIDDVGVTVSVRYPESSRVSYAASVEGPWSETPLHISSAGITTVWVKVSAAGLADFISSVEVNVKDPSADNDGTMFFVSPSGSAVPPYATWETAAKDLQTVFASVAGSSSPVRILVESARYQLLSPLKLDNAAVTVLGYDRSANSVRKGCAVFDAEGRCRVARVSSTKIRGCAFTGGYVYSEGDVGDSGAGVYVDGCSASGGALLSQCVFSNNLVEVKPGYVSAQKGGAGVFVTNALSREVIIEACTFCDNVATAATDTVRAVGGAAWVRSKTKFLDCRFERNVSSSNKSGAGPYGGAVYGDAGNCSAENCTFVSNRCYKVSGSQSTASALYFSNTGSRAVNCEFFGNYGADNGYCQVNGIVSNCVFRSNGSTYGGTSIGSEVSHCAFYGNKGAILRDPSATLRNCLFTGGDSAVVWSYESSNRRVRFENCTFAENKILWQVGNTATLTGRAVIFVNCLANGNENDFVIPENLIAVTPGSYALHVTNCCWETSSDVGDFAAETPGCILLDSPGFISAKNNDFRLRPRSRCREAGVMLPWMAGATDLEGNPRVLDRMGRVSDKALPDIGCYECDMRAPGVLMLLK